MRQTNQLQFVQLFPNINVSYEYKYPNILFTCRKTGPFIKT